MRASPRPVRRDTRSKKRHSPSNSHTTARRTQSGASTEATTPTGTTGSTRAGLLEVSYWGFLLVAIGRVGQLIPHFSSLPLAKLFMGLSLIALISKWKQLPGTCREVKPVLRCAAYLAALAVLTFPISIWPGASFAFLFNTLPVLVAALLLGIKVPRNWRLLRKTFLVLVICALALALTAVSHFSGGRAVDSMTMYDPNDLAYVLISILPFSIGFLLISKKGSSRILYIAISGVILIALLLTGSRGGLLALGAVGAGLTFLPIKGPWARPPDQKTVLVTAVTLLLLLGISAAAWTQLPEATRDRLGTIFNPQEDYNFNDTNPHSRLSIWTRNLPAALHRPIGYGVNTFPMVDLRTGGKFKAAHNSFLEILTELGVLGLLFFLRSYFLTWVSLQKARTVLLKCPPGDETNELLIFSRMLQISLFGNAVAAFFLSMSYSTELWTLIALAVSSTSLSISRGAVQRAPASGSALSVG